MTPQINAPKKTEASVEKKDELKKETVEKNANLASSHNSFWMLLSLFLFALLIIVPIVLVPYLEQRNQQKSNNKQSGNFTGIDEYLGKEGYLAPLFNLSDSDGTRFSLESFKGNKPVVLVFEQTGCGWCQKESPSLEQIAKQYAGQIEIVTVDAGESASTINSYRSENNIQRRWLVDSSKEVAGKYSAYSTPSHFFINSDGYIQNLQVGYLSQQDLSYYIDQML